eukprot:gnl/MRDRNA2_/MRDRNA2_85456_c0_seq1.p1 gnl/MRDRNA2_/MRDRNA2_85456_c0~~gnl/MRDRNA2_/MRDRNA2_85456_c0_seq1.p1  ORF type:complete len:311 (-),score=60.44 gnl/MRDRNA2_/MRDRNA2_85456_c0_seq1:353-1285(-)
MGGGGSHMISLHWIIALVAFGNLVVFGLLIKALLESREMMAQLKIRQGGDKDEEDEEVLCEEVKAEPQICQSADNDEEDEEDLVLIEEVPSVAKRSVLDSSKTLKGSLSYYYCQETSMDANKYFGDAILRDCDPFLRADGCGPKKLNIDVVRPNTEARKSRICAQPAQTTWIEKFSYSGEGPVAKIYIEFPESIKNAEVVCKFDNTKIELLARQPSNGEVYGFRVNELISEIVPEKSKYRISSGGERITLSLHKEYEFNWTRLTKIHKAISSHCSELEHPLHTNLQERSKAHGRFCACCPCASGHQFSGA